ncbi:MAG: DUF3343 domain-containing protein [Oscillospiraceae bacterium]|nr:DUF3343 domain-containing protein [Oscillospiraceae bacterium]
MREKQLRTVVTFHTTAEAMALEQLCKKKGIDGRLISAPRQLSADCGIAWCAPIESTDTLRAVIEENNLEIDGIHELMLYV